MTDNNIKFEKLIEELIALNNEPCCSIDLLELDNHEYEEEERRQKETALFEREMCLRAKREDKRKEILDALPELNPIWKRLMQLRDLGVFKI